MFDGKNILTIDFETHDPYLEIMGPGWAYGMLEVLCCGLKLNNNEVYVTEAIDTIKDYVRLADVIVAHNAQYDIGVLYSLFEDDRTWTKDKIFIDTVLLAKLHKNNEINGYSLESLAEKYLKEKKAVNILGEIVLDHNLINCKDRATKLSKTKAINFAYKNMKKIYELEPKKIQDYCGRDVELSHKLYNIFIHNTLTKHVDDYNVLLRIMIESRLDGVVTSSEELYDIKNLLNNKAQKALTFLKTASGDLDFNPLSPKDVSQVLLKSGKKLKYTPAGNYSITGDWLSEQDDDISKAIVEYRTYEKLSRDFCDNILEMQSLLPEKYKGKIYPTFNLLGAETGRMSCSKPNFQQIPNAKKHKEIGRLIRSAYKPSTGKLWASIDFSAQEPRLTVHYACKVKAEGAELLRQEYIKNPNMDLHQITADLANITRNQAKVLLLGISYGMGTAKLAKSLGIDLEQAKVFLDEFHGKLPYLKQLDGFAKQKLKTAKYITTIDGRKLHIDPPVIIDGRERTFEYKALNKLIQGGSAGQILQAMIKLYKAGFKIIATIHDEINLEVNSIEEALEAKKIMENAIDLLVPSVGELTIGHSWGGALPVEEFLQTVEHSIQ